DGEEDVVARARATAAELAERRHERGRVAVADVVLAPIRRVAALADGRERHLGRVDVGAVLPLREAEREDGALLEQARGALLYCLVAAHPDGAEAQHGDLPRVPVLEPVKPQDLSAPADAPRVPAGVGWPVAGRRRDRREETLTANEVEKIGVPDVRMIVRLQPGLALGLEELDRLAHHLGGAGVRIGPGEASRV